MHLLDTYAFVRRKISKSQVAIIAYHRVSPNNDNWSLKPIRPDNFEKQIVYFRRNYEILSLENLSTLIKEGKRLPEKGITITFDDGYRDNYIYAYPILKRYQIPATIFLTTGHISSDKLFWWDKIGYIVNHTRMRRLCLNDLGDFPLPLGSKDLVVSKITEKLKRISEDRKTYLIEQLTKISKVDIPSGLAKEFILSWNDIKEMTKNGINFGAHTVNHPILANLPIQQAQWEIIESKKNIEEELCKEIDTFSYPNGSYLDFNSEIIDFIKENKFICSVSISPQKLVSLNDDLFALGRILANEDFNRLKMELCGLLGDVERLMRKDG
jgi:peptidoglycan/xylan/chitin deacetylase (PgdA/CDA1 family)